MKKSSFTALVLGTVSGIMFALGMCMALLPQWDAFLQGVILGGIGLVLGLITVIVWRKMEKKLLLHISPKTILCTVVGIVGALLLGVGMCFCMVWAKMVLGIIIGTIGIIVLLCLIPLIKGFKD